MNEARTVLVLSGPDDATADAVAAELIKLDVPIARLNIGDFPQNMTMTAQLMEGQWYSKLAGAADAVDLREVRSVYYRRPTRFALRDGLSDADSVFAAAEAQLGLGGVLAVMDVLWVNNPAHVALAEYKPIQLRIAARSGLMVPRTLVTNDYEAAKEFATTIGGPVICKTLSSLVLSENGQPRITYTTPIDLATVDPDSLAVTAHLLQEQVAKYYDARVTMIGDQPLAVAIRADTEAASIDWRADYDALSYVPIEPPQDIVVGMKRYLDEFELEFGAFDLVVTPQGEWVFLECNPSGQWLWLQDQAGLPIAAVLAEHLASGARR